MESFLKDLRFALRSLRHQPAFTATVVATFALAVGASTAIFSVVESTLLRPLPFRTPDRIAFLWGVAGPQRAIRGGSFIEVQDWSRLNQTFEQVSMYDETSLNLQTADGADRVEAEMVSASYFPMLGGQAQVGRVFTVEEDRIPDANPVVVISDAMWRTRFGADQGIVGRTLTLNDRPFTVVGVMRPDFRGISFDTDVWFPSMMVRASNGPIRLEERGNRWLGAIGRLRPGATLEGAQRDMDRVAAQLATSFPQTNKDRGVQLFALRDSYLGSTRSLVLALFGAVGLFLLIACVNIVGLQLVRATGRRREIALRMAIGADRGRVIQQLVVEGLVLAVAGAVVGFGIAYFALDGLTMLAPDGVLPSYATPSVNLFAFLFTMLVSAVCGVLFGIIPALRASKIALVDALKQGARDSATGFGGRRRIGSQQVLVVAETAIALVLLVGAGLFVRSLKRQLDVDPGFNAVGVTRARLSLPQRYTPALRLQFVEQLERRLAAIPSVKGVAIGSDLPLSGGSSAAFIYVPEAQEAVRYYRHSVTPSFFSALGMTLVRGRAFGAEDREGSPAAVVVSDAMARRFWPGADPIGKRLRLGDAKGAEVTVVGVVGNARYRDLTTPLATSEPDVYFPIAQRPTGAIHIAVSSRLPADQIAAAIRRELGALDRTIALFGVQGLDELLAQQTAQGRFASSILSVFAAAALLLSAIGLYGVLAFLVSLRRREIGIRLALGATNGRVLRSVIGQGVGLATVGLGVGLGAALLATRAIESQLFGVGGRDPLVFAVVSVVLLAVSAIASLIPARRAARVDPQLALKYD